MLGGRYALRERIAAGGMGDVWLVEDRRLPRTLALKIMHPYTAHEVTLAQRFREEALIGTRLSHPNIVAVHDFGEEAGLAYLVMEYVSGRTLAHLLHQEGALDSGRVHALLLQVAAGLGAAHEAGIIHRDIKPANILVTPDGRAKITDFGIARAAAGLALTRTGEVMGTPQYLSPEQALGRSATPASDVYSLGVIGHEMLCGARPFDAETPVATALAHAYHAPPPLPSHTPQPLADVVRECLAKDPRKRPATGNDVVRRLTGEAAPAFSPAAREDRPRTAAAAAVLPARMPSLPPASVAADPPPTPVFARAVEPVQPTDAVADAPVRLTGRTYAVALLVLLLYLVLMLVTRN